MSEINPDVLATVERALKKDPSLSSKELQEQASKVDKSVADLSGRQFHARYALQAKRKLTGPRKRASRKGAAKRKPSTQRATRKAAARKAPAKKAGTRKRAARRRSSGRAAKAMATNDPVRALLREQFEERRAMLDGVLDDAFTRAIEEDSLAKINDLLASLDRQANELQTS